jgi:hypothetical protein
MVMGVKVPGVMASAATGLADNPISTHATNANFTNNPTFFILPPQALLGEING